MNWICRTGWGNSWSSGFGGLTMILFWVAIGIGLFYLFKSVNLNKVEKSPAKTPLELVKERYAKGEITDEDFERIKKKILES